MAIYIQLGAGAGDEDRGTNFRDGFTEYIKQKKIKPEDKIILVEANKLNISLLKKCWKDFKNAIIYNIGIVPDNFKSEKISFFYSTKDNPCYQVFSYDKQHVANHYPDSEILEQKVEVKKISEFLKEISDNKEIDNLAIDIEGMDTKVLFSIDLKQINIKKISIESLHLKNKRNDVLNFLIKYGYSYCGKGFDHRGWDLMFEKKSNIFLKFKTKFFTPKFT